MLYLTYQGNQVWEEQSGWRWEKKDKEEKCTSKRLDAKRLQTGIQNSIHMTKVELFARTIKQEMPVPKRTIMYNWNRQASSGLKPAAADKRLMWKLELGSNRCIWWAASVSLEKTNTEGSTHLFGKLFLYSYVLLPMTSKTQTSHHHFTEFYNKYYTIDRAVRLEGSVGNSKTSVSFPTSSTLRPNISLLQIHCFQTDTNCSLEETFLT